jgi:hypothetical protein
LHDAGQVDGLECDRPGVDRALRGDLIGDAIGRQPGRSRLPPIRQRLPCAVDIDTADAASGRQQNLGAGGRVQAGDQTSRFASPAADHQFLREQLVVSAGEQGLHFIRE